MNLKKFLSYSQLSVFGSYLIEHSLLSINLDQILRLDLILLLILA